MPDIASSAFSGDSLDAVHAYVDRVLGVLRDPSLKGSEFAKSANEAQRAGRVDSFATMPGN